MRVKTVYVEITNLCNLNCATCYNRSGLNRQRRELSFEQIENILLTFRPYGMKRFLFSGGEPTLHSEFDRILGLTEKYPDISFGIVTNGTNHSRKLIDYINTKENLTLQISLDGSCEEVNSLTRGAGNFERSLAFARQIHKTSPAPLLKMVVSQSNFDDVENFCELALSLGFVPEFAYIYRSGNGSDGWDAKALTSMQKLKVLKIAERFNRERDAGIFLPLCTFGCPFSGDELNELSLCVRTDGSIQPCQALYGEKYTVANAMSFDGAEFESNLQNISAVAKQRTAQDYGCKRCMINSICGRGCMAEAVNLHDDPLADDGSCLYRKQQFINRDLMGALPKV